MIAISNFGGMVPRRNPAMLNKESAQLANNCVLWHADLRPLNEPLTIATPGAPPGPIKSIYRIGKAYGETKYWMAFVTDVDVVQGMIAGDVSERVYFTGDGEPKVTNLQMATQGAAGNTRYPVAAYLLGVPAPATKPLCVAAASVAPLETRVYVYTYVSGWGEEGAPSPPCTVQVSEGGAVALSNLEAATGEGRVITAKRIYRSAQTSSGGAIYEFVAEIAIAVTTFNDTVLSSNLGEPLASLTYAVPPATMTGLTALPNGIMAGFSGNDLYFCEPFLPYAWPEKYRLTTDAPIVGIGVFGSSLLVCTQGSPYLVTGVHPEAMSMERIELDQSCVSKRSIVSIGGGVMYASPDGLVYVGAGGSRVVTQELYTRQEWQALKPETIDGYYHDGKYIALYSGQSGGGFILNSIEDASLTLFDDVVTAGYADQRTDALYLIINNVIKRFNAGAAKTYTWRSKPFQYGGRVAPGAARVDADSYPVTFRLYADGVLKHTQNVTDERVFRLPGGYRPRTVEIELSGTNPVRMVAIADNPVELRMP